jgi:hypothetical protein
MQPVAKRYTDSVTVGFAEEPRYSLESCPSKELPHTKQEVRADSGCGTSVTEGHRTVLHLGCNAV